MVVVGPAGAGKTNMLEAAVRDLHHQHRHVLGLAPTAQAAAVLHDDTGADCDTVAKLLYELDQHDPTRPWPIPPAGATILVDEAAMLNTADLYRLVVHTEQRRWRLALVGDPFQLQAVGRGGMFNELCDTTRSIELEELHRFTHVWEAATTLRLRTADPEAIGTYAAHGRISAGSFDDHLATIATTWTQCRDAGESLSIVTTRNEHVTAINTHIQRHRMQAGELDPATATRIDGDWAMVGDIVVTRRNSRQLRTSAGDGVRNRERWTITHTHPDGGEITVSRLGGHGIITLPADYVHEHVQLAYASTEYGAQGATADRAVTLATGATTGRGLYVGMTRGRDHNQALVADTDDLAHAISVLEAAIAVDRADIPATTQRRTLAEPVPTTRPRPRVQVPDWIHDLRADAQQACDDARRRLEERNTERAATRERVATARRDLPAAEEAHAPFAEQVAHARRIVNEAQSALHDASAKLRQAGRLHRRAARTEVGAATDIVSVATDRLERVEQAAAPTQQRVDKLHHIIDHHRQTDSTRRTLDRWNNLDTINQRADDLCQALDHWKRWANGHHVPNTVIADVVATLKHHRDQPGIIELAEPLTRWTQNQGIEPPAPRLSRPSVDPIEIGIDL